MHSFSRRLRRDNTNDLVTRDDVLRFVQLPAEQQHEDLLKLRFAVAHLNGGSFGAFAAVYLTVVLGAGTFLCAAMSILTGVVIASITVGAIVLVGGLGVVVALARQQRNLALDAVRLQAYEDCLRPQAQ
jgi:hypothetical protein